MVGASVVDVVVGGWVGVVGGGGQVTNDTEQSCASSITVGQSHLYPDGIFKQRLVQPLVPLIQGCTANENRN